MVAAKQPPTAPKRGKPGPTRDIEIAKRVAKIVREVTGGDPWKEYLDEICDALDDKEIPPPKTWKNRTPPILDWADAASTEKALAKKAIAHHLNNATE